MSQEKPLSRRERNLADIRERAVPVAERIVLHEGVDALSARGLAKELNVSVGSLYNAFGDLESVVRAVIAKSAGMLSANLHTAVETAPQDRRSRVVALGEAYFDFAIAEPQRWWLMFEYRSNVPLDPKAQDFQTGLLEMLIMAGGADPTSEQHRQFFLLLWASVHGLVSLACRPTIVTINPTVARTYIGDLVDSGLNAFPAD
ncbi:MAG: AcrR family transcriptional regulator [Paracoccaceae bacterium]|jgi:AcrR family transcriptional regulator